ncbi:AraC family transcriptional regulator [Modicisalibacter radicis]|uniref:AraC family transcriptional regulator n=1 Tax=Halomonas sp. EAR18 TaxID=2518972 RepID=UPI00109D3F9A|nr:AraC family transcriptional regulator [Halomonas sp. EAR18]
MTDPFSHVLATIGTRSVRGTGLEASGDWALAFDGRSRLKFIAVTRGHCWLWLPDDPPRRLVAGDISLLSGTRYVVASDPAIEPTDGMPLYAAPGQNLVRLGTGRETAMIGGGSEFVEGGAGFILDALPRYLPIERDSQNADAIGRTLAALQSEVDREGVGGSLIAERLAEILVIEAVRAHIASGPSECVGWITALADRRIGKALQMMHGNVAHPWTVPMLATAIGMSRTAFTDRFKARVGIPSIAYLIRWRMLVAQQALDSGQSVARVAESVGYSSQSAFSCAYKRTLGRTPRGG